MRTKLTVLFNEIVGTLKAVSVGVLVCAAGQSYGQTVELHKHDAIVWSTQQIVSGHFDNAGPSGVFYVDTTGIPFVATSDSFEVAFEIGAGSHVVYACGDTGQETVCSDTLRLTLGFDPKPEVFAWAEVSDAIVSLHAQIVDHPGEPPFSFSWTQDPRDPIQLDIQNPSDSVAMVVIPGDLANGEYFFDVEVTNGSGAVGRARTFVTQADSALVAFDIWSDHASWVDSAVVYEITPYNFVANGSLQDVRERLSEFADLGVNTIWLQPHYETFYGGQGYDVTNYFKIRADYGNEGTLRTIVKVAHNLGMRVMLDFVPNHSSLQHPYARDAIDNGSRSHYFDFYQRELDDAPYSRHYNQRNDGLMTFTYYFWADLVNLNYDNPEVRRWISEAGQHWIEEFDIDGYRIDAVWGVNARTPEAMQEWRFNLKRIKPEVFLLGEDKSTRPESFEKRFDAAYDWYPEEGWVSHWTWQYDFSTSSNPTIFNHPNERVRSNLLRESLTNRGQGFHPDAKVFRFLENNDTFRFAATHPPSAAARTQMAAALLFTLPGIPMLYNGQEIGFPTHPYQTYAIFDRGTSIARQDRLGIYPIYRHLAHMRRRHLAFTLGDFDEIDVEPASADDYVFSFTRSFEQDHALVVINMSGSEATVDLDLRIGDFDLPESSEYFLTDLLTGEYMTVEAGDPGPLTVTLPPYTTSPLLISDRVVNVSLPTSTEPEFASEVELQSSVYPNPFSDQTVIQFGLDRPAHVTLTVFDLLGRIVNTVVDRDLEAGNHRIRFDASKLAKGAYVYRLEGDRRSQTGMMIKSQ